MKHALALVAALLTAAPPPQAENASATRLMATFERFGDDVSTIRRGRVPAEFLQKHANTIRTLRAEIVSDEPPIWTFDSSDILQSPDPPLRTHIRLFSILGADALAQKNSAAAWADLHAMWILSRSLLQRPESLSIRIGLLGRRRVDAVAALLGPPLPAWWREYKSFDTQTPAARADVYDARMLVAELKRELAELFD